MDKVARDAMMDAFKGVAILLVVLGHSLQNLSDFDNHLSFRVIYAFHMPLFMFLSGYVAFYGRDNRSWQQLTKKATTLVMPFVAWYAIAYVVTGAFMTTSLKHYVKLLLLSPDMGLWFLWVLFLNFVLLAAALWTERWLKWTAIPIAWLLLQMVPLIILGVPLLKWHFAFFALGFLAHRHQDWWLSRRKWLATGGLLGFPLLVGYWHRGLSPGFAPALAATLTRLHLSQLGPLILELYTYVVPICGIIAVWTLVKLLLNRFPTVCRVLGWFGLYTLDIYVTHQYFLKYAIGHGFIRVATGFGMALVGSLAVSFLVVRRNEISAHILLGKPYPKREMKTARQPALVVSPTPLPAD